MKFSSTFSNLLLLASSVFAQYSEQDRLLKLGQDVTSEWYTTEQMFDLIKNRVKFVDVTERQVLVRSAIPYAAIPSTFEIPLRTRYHAEARKAIRHLNQDNARKIVEKLASWNNRFYNNTDGVAASEWIHQQASEIAGRYGKKASSSLFKHKFPQSSIIARIEGSLYPDEIVVIGGHMDSINYTQPFYGRAPGAEDNASGSSVILEAFHALTRAGFKPKRTLEFHWYAGEEVGLYGSADIAQTYHQQNKNVVAQMTVDMVGFLESKVRIINDFTNHELNQFTKRLIESYTDVWWIDAECGYGCSDHASWTEFGFKSTIAAEDVTLDDLTHTQNDTIDIVNFNRWLTFAKIATGYLVELGEPTYQSNRH